MKVLVIGCGMVGIQFCEILKKFDINQLIELSIFGEERFPPYNRVLLSEYFSHFDYKQLFLKPKNWFKERSINIIQEKVTEIKPDQKIIFTNQNSYSFDKLIIATGSYPFVPPIEGLNSEELQFSCFAPESENKNLFVYRTIQDLERIYKKAKESKKCIVVGGGLLGLEAGRACLNLGLETSIVELENRLMPQQLDEEGGYLLTKKIQELGVKVYLKSFIKKIYEKNNKLYVTLNNDEKLETDFVIFSVGIRPRDELARKCGISTGSRGGIVVNSFMQTSYKDIYAIGEVALFDNKIYGLVLPGYQMAEVAAKHILQIVYPSVEIKDFKTPFLVTKLKVIGLEVASFGKINGENTYEIKYKNEDSFIYKKIIFDKKTKKILGGIFLGDLTNFSLISQKVEEEYYHSKSELTFQNIENLLFTNQNAAKLSFSLEDFIVCKCNGINKKQILNSIGENKIQDLETLKLITNAGTGCGGCINFLQEILDSEFKVTQKNYKKFICEHFHYTRTELFNLIKIKKYKTFKEVLKNHGQGIGCEICKPAIASILASLWNTHVLKEETIQDTNDKFLANIQKGGSYSIVPRIPGGEITPDKLIAIGKIAKKYNLYCKITGGQRIDLFGAQLDDLPSIWNELINAGFESGHAYAKGLRTVKSCVGSTWCRFGVQDSTSLAIKIENRYKGLRAPHKIKAAVSGCIRECAEAQSKDFGIIATEKGWNLYVCGNGGAKPQHAVLLAQDLSEETLIKYIDRFLMYYIKTADKLTRTATWFNQLEGGLEHLKDVIINDSLGIASELEDLMENSLKNYKCEWKEAIENIEIKKKFKTFVNTIQKDPSIVFKSVREQKVPLK